jgi:uncharacterized protein YbaP (TraB family)
VTDPDSKLGMGMEESNVTCSRHVYHSAVSKTLSMKISFHLALSRRSALYLVGTIDVGVTPSVR